MLLLLIQIVSITTHRLTLSFHQIDESVTHLFIYFMNLSNLTCMKNCRCILEILLVFEMVL